MLATQYTQPEDVDEDCFDVIQRTLQVEQAKRPTSTELQEMAFLKGPKEKLVLQHCEFMIEKRTHEPNKWLEQFKEDLKEIDVILQEKGPSGAASSELHSKSGMRDEEGEVDSTVRTVDDDEEAFLNTRKMRSISVHVLRCVHETQNVVFKVTVTMMSPDAGQKSPFPVVSFDLQVLSP